jgi:S-adenosylmethionine synthetase
MELIVTEGSGSPGKGPVEIVERKGLGHPDTICDGIAEHFSARLCRAYLDRFGFILHHNVDKVLLAAGRSRPAFGGGELVEPIQIILAGRATAEWPPSRSRPLATGSASTCRSSTSIATSVSCRWSAPARLT